VALTCADGTCMLWLRASKGESLLRIADEHATPQLQICPTVHLPSAAIGVVGMQQDTRCKKNERQVKPALNMLPWQAAQVTWKNYMHISIYDDSASAAMYTLCECNLSAVALPACFSWSVHSTPGSAASARARTCTHSSMQSAYNCVLTPPRGAHQVTMQPGKPGSCRGCVCVQPAQVAHWPGLQPKLRTDTQHRSRHTWLQLKAIRDRPEIPAPAHETCQP
jgi:hypothetical protein